MKIAVIYSSKTGNTKKIADAVLEGAGADAQLFSAKDSFESENYDLIFIGYWVDKGSPNQEAAEFMATVSNKRVALFATLGAYPDSQHAKDSLEQGKTCLGENCKVANSFICQGAIDPKLLDWMRTLPNDHPHSPDKNRIKRWEDASTHPDNKDLKNAKEFAENVLRTV